VQVQLCEPQLADPQVDTAEILKEVVHDRCTSFSPPHLQVHAKKVLFRMPGGLAATPAEPTIRGLQSHNASDAGRTPSEQVSLSATTAVLHHQHSVCRHPAPYSASSWLAPGSGSWHVTGGKLLTLMTLSSD
jgi:hypothetical protein